MSRETAARDMSLNALAVLTGGLTAAALVGTGLVTGLAADYTAQKTQAKAMSKAAAAQLPVASAPQPRATPLPSRTVVTTRHVRASGPVGRQPGGSTSVGSTGRAAAPAAARAPAPVAVRAPAAAPAPSAAS